MNNWISKITLFFKNIITNKVLIITIFAFLIIFIILIPYTENYLWDNSIMKILSKGSFSSYNTFDLSYNTAGNPSSRFNMLQSIDLYSFQKTLLYWISLIIIWILTFFLYIFGLFKLYSSLFSNTRKLLLLLIIVALVTLLIKILQPLSPFIAPIPFAAIVVSILFNPVVSLFTIVHLSIVAALFFYLDFSLFIILLFSSVISVYTVKNAVQRTMIVRAGVEIAIANVFLITLFGVLLRITPQQIIIFCFWGILNGLISSILSLGLLPFLENIFNIITPMRLVELSNPNHYLLKKLMVEAPGTYQHSLMVANLAEAAAEAIGANGLLIRIGCYYHDVGKLKRPLFFIENQKWADNPHNKLAPQLSATIITNHTKDGVSLLREYRLPAFLYDFVREHHGKGLVAYFYRQMLQQKDKNFDEEEFRYDGPKPQSKETALLMLADTIEAAVRSLEKPTPNKIESLIDKLFKEKLNDNQLDSAPLTLLELTTIKEAFVRILVNTFHNRIEYPEVDTENGETGSSN